MNSATKAYIRRVMPKVEIKQLHVHQNEVQISTLTQTALVEGPSIVQGTAWNNRVGNEVCAHKLEVRGVLYNNSTSESMVRMLILSTKTHTDLSEVFISNTGGSTSGTSTIGGLDTMYYPINEADFRIHTDKIIKLAGSATGNAGANAQVIKHTVKFPKIRVKYDNNATGAFSQNWRYYVFYIAADSNDDTSTGTVVELSALTRFFFTDS